MWRPIVGFEQFYEVNDRGDVLSLRSGRLLHPQPNRRGYQMVTLCGEGVRKSADVHRLVALAWLGEPAAGQQVRHLNGDTSDNRAANLAWGSASENTVDQVRHGTHHLARRSHCPQGHAYDELNTYRRPDGNGRECRACALKRSKAWQRNRTMKRSA